jgi:ATP-binding cassette subfamily B (MDR/TAP) protein 6
MFQYCSSQAECTFLTAIPVVFLALLISISLARFVTSTRILLNDAPMSPSVQNGVWIMCGGLATLCLISFVETLYWISRSVTSKDHTLPWQVVVPSLIGLVGILLHSIDFWFYVDFPYRYEVRTHGVWLSASILSCMEVVFRAVSKNSPRESSPWNEVATKTGFLASSILRFCIWLGLLIGGVALTVRMKHLAATGYQPIEDGKEKKETTWKQRLAILGPYLWPRETATRLLVSACFVILLLGRVTNLASPYNYKTIVDKLSLGEWPLKQLILFAVLKLLQGGGGILGAAQELLWLPLSQTTTRTISMQSFSHLHSLSTRFHLNKKTGEVIRSQNRGVSSIVSLLEIFLFRLGPMLLDTCLAAIYFALQFDLGTSGIVFGTACVYIIASVKLTAWRMSHRKDMNQLDNAVEGRAVDSLLNHETVKLFANEQFESKEYEKAIRAYQKKEFKWDLIVYGTSFVQNIILQIGTLLGAIRCARQVIHGDLTVGDFVLFLSLAQQVFGNIGWIGGVYRQLQRNAIDCDQLVDLLHEPIEVKDAENAQALICNQGGDVVFDHVTFAYDPARKILDDVSFHVPAGKSLALIGESGSGKTTVGRLLIRLYDVSSGKILIDGQDIRSVTQQSLRKHAVGVVPQDTPLFNTTILDNIRYGRSDATDDEVKEAAKVAQIYDRIEDTFPEKWETVVGERGLRLSGGEKQRVAIARMVLKAPSVLLLDESTSALDSTTERALQSSLADLLKNRTSIVIAHRLSTVVDCDEIAVMSHGKIIEKGSFHDLMALDGAFKRMWTEQAEGAIRPESRAEERPSTPAMRSQARGRGRGRGEE